MASFAVSSVSGHAQGEAISASNVRRCLGPRGGVRVVAVEGGYRYGKGKKRIWLHFPQTVGDLPAPRGQSLSLRPLAPN